MFSKTKVENIMGLFFNTINMALYLATMTSAAMKIRLITDKNVSHILTCIYAFVSCLGLIVLEVKTFHKSLKLFTLYRSKSLIFILLGGIIFSLLHPFILFIATADLTMGLGYMLLSFFPSSPSPRTIIENWQNWQEYSAEGLDLDRPERKNNDVEDDNATRLRKSMIETPPRSKSSSPV